jgi:hypothetical protein
VISRCRSCAARSTHQSLDPALIPTAMTAIGTMTASSQTARVPREETQANRIDLFILKTRGSGLTRSTRSARS